MTKFVCVRSSSCHKESTRVGDILEGDIINLDRWQRTGQHPDLGILVTKDSDNKDANGNPYWGVGDKVPMDGGIWGWEEVQ